MYTDLIKKDLDHVWHPCTYMQDLQKNHPLVISSAKGSYLETDQGPIIDAISSWWCKSLGHGHPEVITAIKKQLDKFEHVITANTTNKVIVALAEELSKITGKKHVFFASDGACAVEIALKLSVHASKLKGYTNKTKFVSLENSYHGDTFGAMSVSDLGAFKKTYSDFQLNTTQLSDVPYRAGPTDPNWQNCELEWEAILAQLNPIKEQIAAIIFEPIMQGAAGMRCYSPALLSKLREFAKANDIYIIADEIMTGLGRTGEWLAQSHANIRADFTCLSKGLTSGSMPLSLTMIDEEIYNLFYQDYAPGSAFLHSHTYSGNPVAASAALATLTVMQRDDILKQSRNLGEYMQKQFSEIINTCGKLTNYRSIGAIVAADLENTTDARLGYLIAQAAQKRGALLRPIGNSIYWLPPLNTNKDTIDKLAQITFESIQEVYKQLSKDQSKCYA